MTIRDETTRQRVRVRANNRCEYCLSRQEYIMGRLQVDHIWPLVKGGNDEEANLCLACELCNQYKWTQTHAIDPLTVLQTRLFHPRLQNRSDPFRWNEAGDEIEGLTACGRATVLALRLNNDLAVTVRRNWIKAGWHPPVIK